MTDLENKNYPNTGQSLGIVGILILGILLLSPLIFILNKFIEKDASSLIYYLFAIGIPFCIVFSLRKQKTGCSTFNFKIKNKWIVPFVILSTVGLFFGVSCPVVG